MEALLDSGFHHVVVLDGAECGLDAEQSLILALWCYEADSPVLFCIPESVYSSIIAGQKRGVSGACAAR